MASRLAIYHPPGALSDVANPFGKDVANLGLYQALARHGGFERLDVLSTRPADEAALRAALTDGFETATHIAAGSVLDTALAAEAGTLLRGQPYLPELAWLRRHAQADTAYSLLGLVHTIAPPTVRQMIANASLAPVHPWDAIVCTSPAVRDALAEMFAQWGDWLAERTGGGPPPAPMLPVMPLGVDGPALAALADRPAVRARRRAALGLDDTAILVLWVGRLSYFEKAFPQPMFRALQRAGRQTGAKLQFAMAGWFPSERDRARFEEAAKICAPDVDIRLLDGNDRELVGELWAAADIFLSLVDNIQETFGITPLEAMAAGLPIVASDWDGYRHTMRDGVEAFLIPTLIPPAGGTGVAMAQRHKVLVDVYQQYVGAAAQFTAVHVGRAAEALTALIRSPELRRTMGRAGRARVADAFDWPVVARRYVALLDELAAIRAKAEAPAMARRLDPVSADPFGEFAGFATHPLSLETMLRATPGLGRAEVMATAAVELDQGFSFWRASLEECAEALDLLAKGKGLTLREVLLAFPARRRRAVELGLAWMAKQGFVDWLT